ncbi:unnamed protein product [Brassicogethes aeneus]|uniref:Transferrin n=1 Tax=Brassicogethes aeneus TaxID=1431903 RepID=A0A9P0BCM3_BRAAE|nr:unnamed protein product [Brassicogethes aeneus]
MFRSSTCVVAALACLSFVYCDKYRICVVDSKGGYKVSNHYCPTLTKLKSNIECVVGIDRLDCLRHLSKGTADFTVLTAEDLVTAHTSEIEVLVTNELRYTSEKYEYELVAVVNKKSGITSRHHLKDKKYCHPGYGYEEYFTKILVNYFESTVVPQSCNPKLTINENRIKATSDFFKSSCKAGPWVHDPQKDDELKQKYPNLCAICGSPNCNINDKYWGRRGPLLCLTDGAGDVSWTRWDDVQIHFGLTPGDTESSPDDFSLLCPDDTLMPVNTTNPCVWVAKPWSVVVTKRSSAQDLQSIISNLSTSDQAQFAVLNLMSATTQTVEKIYPIEAIETYLNKATGFLSANSFSGCHPPRTIRICTTSIVENAKCSWLRETAAVYGIEPDIDCLKADNTTHCMLALNTNNAADVVMVSPDLTNKARRDYNLQPLFYETVYNNEKYVTVAVTRQNSDLEKLEDLQGKKACFPVYDGMAWNTVKHSFHMKNLLKCPSDSVMMNYFGPSCAPEYPKESHTTSGICDGDNFNGELGALKCLTSGKGDVAFLSKNTLLKFLQDNKDYKLEDFKIVCGNSSNACHLGWSPVGYGMIRTNSSEVWKKDTLDVFLQLDELFGKNFKSLTSPYTMYGKYDGKSDLLFQDETVRIRSVPMARNTDTMSNEFESLIKSDTPCLASSQEMASPYLITIFVNLLLFYVFC